MVAGKLENSFWFFLYLEFSSELPLQAFSGTQNVSSLQKDEAWKVNVRIQGIDLDNGYLCGTMEALNVPLADTPVRRFTNLYLFCYLHVFI